MPRPDTFIVGAPKCGTTAMNTYLGQHPEVFIPTDKDTRFFGQDLTCITRLSEKEYIARYDDSHGSTRRVDASVYYLLSHDAAAEIHTFSPDAYIVAMLRDPVEMTYSHHAQLRFNGLGEDEDITVFADALAAESDRRDGQRIPPGTRVREALYYRELADYATQLQRYFHVFGRDRVHVILFDDFRADTHAAYQSLLEFLQVDSAFEPQISVVNPNTVVRFEALRSMLRLTPDGLKTMLPTALREPLRQRLRSLNTRVAKRPPLEPDVRRALATELRPGVERLATLIDRDLSHWCSDAAAT